MLKSFLFYCRSGYESDLQAELTKQFSELSLFGYAKFTKNSAFVRYLITNDDSKRSRKNACNNELSLIGPKFDALVFARQKLYVMDDLTFSTTDRVQEIITYLSSLDSRSYGSVMVEHADSEQGKELAKFCKKFTVPLRNALRKHKLVNNKSEANSALLPNLHIFMEDSASCVLAYSLPSDRSESALGIKRLKMPPDAPSRSTLKLEEAILTFLNSKQSSSLLRSSMRAVDLGACPGGWTYQLVKRKLKVEAVDHGVLNQKLLDTGLVEYYSEDGFLYQPKEGNVDWLVCDMIEQPSRVGELILSWLIKGKANAAIFNLKLPMNKRFKVVESILEKFSGRLHEKFGKEVIIKAKHLFHNRDEITVFVIVNSQMLSIYQSLTD